jgi:ABC-type Zn2+ transport system substrate-binding protein/surface adhesin
MKKLFMLLMLVGAFSFTMVSCGEKNEEGTESHEGHDHDHDHDHNHEH